MTNADGSPTRSGLAFTFLGLVERHRPRAVLLENVPGLLSSHAGRDMARLLGEMVELGYGVAYRVLDARYFGVPQRRRRVFIVGLRSDPDDPSGRVAAERAAAVLAVGTRCPGHPPAGVKKGPGAADRTGDGTVGTFTAGAHPGSYNGQDAYTGHLVTSPSPDADRVRTTHGMAAGVDGGGRLAPTLNANKTGGWRYDADQVETLVPFVKAGRAQTADAAESWRAGDVMPTLNSFDTGDSRTTAAIVGFSLRGRSEGNVPEPFNGEVPAIRGASGGSTRPMILSGPASPDSIDPPGLDSHRFRCVGNGVVAPVAEWIGLRLAEALRG